MSKSMGDNDRGFIDDAVYRAMYNLDINCFGTGDFLRDYLHISDLAEALATAYLMESKLKLLACTVYHSNSSWLDLVCSHLTCAIANLSKSSIIGNLTLIDTMPQSF